MASIVDKSENLRFPKQSESSYYNYYYGYQDDWYNLDGAPWAGSFFELGKYLFPDSIGNAIKFHNICCGDLPKIIFDYGNYIGYPDFDYIFIPGSGNSNITYGIFALTNNKTVLQKVGQLNFYEPASGDSNSVFISNNSIPDENYSPS